MGALRKAGVWLGLVEDDEAGYADGGYEEFEDELDEPVMPLRPRVGEPARELVRDPSGHRSTVRPITHTAASGPVSAYQTRDNLALAPQLHIPERAIVDDLDQKRYQITTLHPTTYNEARTIGEHFRNGVPVIMNLTEMAEADAKRLVDFAAGLIFGLRGSMERVTNRVFLLSPANVQVTAEDKARIAEGGFFNQS